MEISRKECMYTACYCEENIWKLCEKVSGEHPDSVKDCWVIFASNKERCVSIWNQQKAHRPGAAVFWDYHVFLLFAPAAAIDGQIFDFDTILPFPCRLDLYIRKALRRNHHLQPTSIHPAEQCQTVLRIIPAAQFLQDFASDRSHMWNDITKKYNSPPPEYPCIRSKTCLNNIQHFIEMESDKGHGHVMALESFSSVVENSADMLPDAIAKLTTGSVDKNHRNLEIKNKEE